MISQPVTEDMRFIFIGASGFVGRHALRLTREAGHDAIGTQSTPRSPDLVKFNLLEDRIKPVLSSLSSDSHGPTWGVICASIRQIDQCFRERDITRQVNVVKTIELIEDFLQLGIRPIFLSTSYVFDGAKGCYTEKDAHSACCEYGRQKAEVEAYLAQHHPEVLVLRLDKIVGDDPAEEHLFSEWLTWVREGKPITCISGQVMSPTLAQDIGRALLAACNRDLKGLYNTANPACFSREELAAEFLAVTGLKAEIVSKPQSSFRFDDPRPTKTCLDSSKFIGETGLHFTPMRDVLAAFARKAGLKPG